MGYVRFLLAICVVVAHAGPLPIVGYMAGGTVAVQCFFMMSGFYMALVLDRKYKLPVEFYWNRFSRIFSGYWVALVFALIVMYLCNDNLLRRIFESNLTYDAKILAYVSNFLIFGTDIDLFVDATPDGLAFASSFAEIKTPINPYLALPQSWSLAVELQFYLIAPIVLKRSNRLIAIFCLSIVVQLILTKVFGSVDPWMTRVFPVTLKYFVIGVGVYKIMPIAKNATKIHGIIALILMLGGIVAYDILPISEKWLLFVVVGIGIPFVMKTISNRLDTELGEISYMLYLVHVPVLFAFQFVGYDQVILVAVFSVLISFVLHPFAKTIDVFFRSKYLALR